MTKLCTIVRTIEFWLLCGT